MRRTAARVVLSATMLFTWIGCGSEDAPPSAVSNVPAGAVCTPDTWEAYAQPFFATHCVHCHEKLAGYPRVAARAQRITHAIEEGRMPKDGLLPEADKQRILTWLYCDAPFD